MSLILGIDAAWTKTGSSGVVLLDSSDGGRVIVCAPSYASFVAHANEDPICWSRPTAGVLDVSTLLDAAKCIGGRDVDVVAIDMPIATTKIVRRRIADQEISIKFGGAWASAHSPTAQRPGEYSDNITKQFEAAGFSLVTKEGKPAGRSLIEVYPLAALVRLMNVPKRPLYKVSKSNREWPKLSRDERILELLKKWREILNCLNQGISDLNFPMPKCANTLRSLKPYEDALDAIISAYVGALYLNGAAESFGDDVASIWVPKPGPHTHMCNTDGYLAAVTDNLCEWDSPPDEEAFRNL
jgi:predicted RNase H-like nuclease